MRGRSSRLGQGVPRRRGFPDTTTTGIYPRSVLDRAPLPVLQDRLAHDWMLHHVRRLRAKTAALCRFLGLGRRQVFRRLEKLGISRGAMACGFPDDQWTLKRIASAIRRKFRVRMHPGHIWKLLRRKGWTCQVPERRPIARVAGGIERGKQEKLRAARRRPKTWCPPRLPR